MNIRPPLILLVSLIVISSKSEFTGSVDGEVQGENDIRIRSTRAGNNKIAEVSEKLSILSLITNAVHLQAQLTDELFPIEQAIEELLNFAPLKLSEVENFKGNKMAALVKELETISKSLDSSDMSKKVEDFSLGMSYLKHGVNRLRYLDNLMAGGSYFGRVKDFQKDFNDLNVFEDFTKLHEKLVAIEKMDVLVTDETGQKKDELIDIFVTTKKLLNSFQYNRVDNIYHDIHFLFMHLQMDYGDEPFTFITEMMERRGNIKDIDLEEEKNVLIKNVEALSKLPKIAMWAHADLSLLIELLDYRLHHTLIPKDSTHSFEHGIDDLKKLTDKSKIGWLEKQFKKYGKLSALHEGLGPLLKVRDALDSVDKELVAVTNQQKLTSLQKVERLLARAAAEPRLYSDLRETLTKLSECRRIVDPADVSKINTSIVTRAKQVYDHVVGLRTTYYEHLACSDCMQMGDAWGFNTLFPFTDLGDSDKVHDEIKEILAKLKGDSKQRLVDFTKKVESSVAIMKNHDKTIMQNLVDNLLNGGKEAVRALLDDSQVVQEIEKVYTCLQKVNPDQLEVVVQFVREARDVTSNDIADVKEVALATEKFARKLADLKKIPDMIINEKSSASYHLGFMPDLWRGPIYLNALSKILENMKLFRELDTSSLQTIGRLVSDEYNKLGHFEQHEVSEFWGNYSADLASLNRLQNEVTVFEKGLDLSRVKTLADLCEILGGIAKVGGMSLLANIKATALNLLISRTTNSSVKKLLGDAKETLYNLTTISLNYTSGRELVEPVQEYLRESQNFVESYLVEMSYSDPTEPENLSSVEFSTTSMIVLILVLSILLGAVGVAIYFYSDRIDEYFERSSKGDIKFWLEEAGFKNGDEAYKAHSIIHQKMQGFGQGVDQNKSFLPASKRRDTEILCNEETAVKIKDGNPIHATMIETDFGPRFIATQGPIHIAEKLPGKDDTCEDFWAMVYQEKCEFIVMLCNFKEDNESKWCQYFSLEKGGSEKFGKFKVTTESVEEGFMKDETGAVAVDKRRIVVEPENGTPITVTHFHYKTWSEKIVPKNPRTCNDIHNAVEKSKTPIAVHCSTGVGRTVAFIGIKYMAQKVMHRWFNVTHAIIDMCELRWHGLQSWNQSYLIHIGAYQSVAEKYKMDLEVCKTQLQIYEDTVTKRQGAGHDIAADVEDPDAFCVELDKDRTPLFSAVHIDV